MLSYLSRYVFRTAISNARILGMDQTHVTFRWKDRTADAWRTERLPGVEFLGRFFQHVLPRGFHKVRYYGLWHPSKREQVESCLVALDPGGAGRRRATTPEGKPPRGAEPAVELSDQASRRGGGS